MHLGLLATFVVCVTVIQIYPGRNRLPNLWVAPFNRRAANRVLATLRPRTISAKSIARMPIAILLLTLLLWAPYREAAQPIAALSPAFTVNAWGGPSYLGATVAHWLDGVILFCVSALLLHLVLVPNGSPRLNGHE